MFSDVDDATPHAQDIYWLADEGVSQGWLQDDGTRTFKPMDTIKRCDMAAFLYRLAGEPDYTPSGADKSRFIDVDDATPHAKEVRRLAKVGISMGWNDGTFRPYEEIARCDMAAFLRRTARLLNRLDAETWHPENYEERYVFRDVDDDTPHDDDIIWLHHSGVSTGYADGTFRSLSSVYRQDMAAFLHRTASLPVSESENVNTDHVHAWTDFAWETFEHGNACNGCARNVTNWDGMFSCCGGWHTHTWYLSPSSYTCSICGTKKHEHAWYYHPPTYYAGSNEIAEEEYWECYRCGAQSADGATMASIETTYNGFKRGAINFWSTPFDFSADATTWVLIDKSWEEADASPELQSITMRGPQSMAPGDDGSFEVVFTPTSASNNATLTWKSSDSSVVSIDDKGNVKAHSVGTATITVECNDRADSAFIRVTEENIGAIKSARLLVGGQSNPDNIITLDSNGTTYEVTLATNPTEAIYNVRYAIEDEIVDSSSALPWTGSIFLTGSSSCGNLNEWSWQNNPTFTNPITSIKTGKPGTAAIVATVEDMNGNKVVLEQKIVIK